LNSTASQKETVDMPAPKKQQRKEELENSIGMLRLLFCLFAYLLFCFFEESSLFSLRL
jgi:hypothetical protein